MRDIGEGTIRRIDWQELTPVVLLLRIFNVATGLRVLSFALIGVLLTLLGGPMFNVNMNLGSNPIVVSFRQVPGEYVRQLALQSVFVPWDLFTSAGFHAFSLTPHNGTDRAIAFGCLAYLLFVWTICGGLICRTVALRLTIDESDSFGQLLEFMKKRGSGFIWGPVTVMLGVLFCLLPVWLAGWLYSVPVLSYPVAVFFPIALLFGFFAVILALGLMVGWPLLFASVGVDGTDGFDAIGRMFSYVFQRPLHYLLYWTFVGILGILGYVFVSLIVDGTSDLTILFGGFSGKVAVNEIGDVATLGTLASQTGPEQVVLFWCTLLQLFKVAYTFTWFWTSSVAIYLLLRRSVDATPIIDVYQLGARTHKPRVLPNIVLDVKGAPEVAGQNSVE